MKPGSSLLVLLLAATGASAQEKPLLIPQIEGGKQGRVVGRAIACGVPQERTSGYLQAARERMIEAVGKPLTQDRYLPFLSEAIEQEASLGKPSDAACAKALDAFGRLEAGE